MVDRITSVDLRGGPRGLGLVVAEKDMAPHDWYFPCHFKDDQVLAGSLIGEACAQNFFALVAWGDASLDVAKRNGQISKVREISYKSTNVLGYQEFCTVVTGE